MKTICVATFFIGENLFGIDIPWIREINANPEITPVPGSPQHIQGLMNLRGQIVTVFNLRSKLGFEASEEPTPSHVVILKRELELSSSPEDEAFKGTLPVSDKIGFLVEGIDDAITIHEEDIEPPPASLGTIQFRYLAGVVKLEKSLLTLLDLKSILKHDV